MNLSSAAAHLRALEKTGHYEGLIVALRDFVAEDKRILTHPTVKDWCGRRWRNLFISAALEDKAALKVAGKRGLLKDKRPPRQKISERFLKGDENAEWAVELPPPPDVAARNVTLLFCPGLLNGLLPDPAFRDEFPALKQERGWKFLRADAHPMRSCEANNADLLATLNRGEGATADSRLIKPGKGKAPGDVMLMGYSKGGPDILTLLAHHPEIRPRVRCVFTWAGAIGGSYTADNIHSLIKEMDIDAVVDKLNVFLKVISPAVVTEGKLRRFDEYDIKAALKSLTTWERGDFLKRQGKKLDAMNLPFFCITAATTVMEVPTFQMQDTLNLNRFDANNDMQLTQEQARLDIPMATHLAMLHGHHWDISYPPFPLTQRMGSPNLDHPFPRKAALEAIFGFAAELGLID